MTDCPDGGMRDQLPAYVHGRLDEAARAAVAAHLATCADCAAEVALLQTARRVLDSATPAVDVRRIVAALPAPPVAAIRKVVTTGKVWSTWRIAASVATIAIGGLSVAVVQRLAAPPGGGSAVVAPSSGGRATTPTAPAASPIAPPVVANNASGGSTAVSPPSPAGHGTVLPKPRQGAEELAAAEPADQAPLTVGGGTKDMSEAEMQALLGAMDKLDGVPDANPQPALPGLHSTGSL